MKIKKTIAILAGLVLASSAFSQSVTFANDSDSLVIDNNTGAAVAPGVVQAGLFYNPDPGAAPNLKDPGANGWIDSGLVYNVSSVPVPQLYGLFSGGTVVLPTTGTVGIQAMVWSAGYATYADALASTDAQIGMSEVAPIPLAEGATPPQTTAAFFNQTIDLELVPEPSTVVLGILGGLGALVLLRRRL